MSRSEPEIRPATEPDFDEILRIFWAVIEPGDAFTFSPETTENQARAFLEDAWVELFRRLGRRPDPGSLPHQA